MPIRAIILLLPAALVIGGCGYVRKHGATVTLKRQSVTIVAGEYFFNPEVIHAKPGRLDISFRNGGKLVHELELDRGGQAVAEIHGIDPKRTTSATVNLSPGSYELFCSLGDHKQLGMEGKILVK